MLSRAGEGGDCFYLGILTSPAFHGKEACSVSVLLYLFMKVNMPQPVVNSCVRCGFSHNVVVSTLFRV